MIAVFPPTEESTWASRVVGTWAKPTPRLSTPAANPVRSPITPPPSATINPLRSLGFRNGNFFVLDAIRPAANLFTVGETHLGKAVFAAQPFAEGDRLIEFTGRRFRAARVPSLMRGQSDRFVQVTPDHYMGPSGRIDDLINHSCAPNCEADIEDGRVFIRSKRAIQAGEELFYDYGLVIDEPLTPKLKAQYPCWCGAPRCRGTLLAPKRGGRATKLG